MLVISVHGKNDLFLITGSTAKVSTNFSPKDKRSFLYVVLAQAFLPYNELQWRPSFAFIVFFQFCTIGIELEGHNEKLVRNLLNFVCFIYIKLLISIAIMALIFWGPHLLPQIRLAFLPQNIMLYQASMQKSG